MIKDQEKVWDAIAEQWYHFRQKQFEDVSKEIEKLAKLKKGKILEIGCGNCRNLRTFGEKNFECYGIDFSKEMLKYAKKYCKKYNFKVKLKKARAEKLPFKDNSFDYILNIATLHHLNKKQQIECIKEMRRVLKNGGLALISVWNKKSKKKYNYVPWQVKGKKYWRYYYFFTMSELKKLFKKYGFRILKEIKNKNLILLVKLEKK
ncbi:MAG: class I SAM-dependent methyltransferase [Candidatus Pacearchaeota archaeon]